MGASRGHDGSSPRQSLICIYMLTPWLLSGLARLRCVPRLEMNQAPILCANTQPGCTYTDSLQSSFNLVHPQERGLLVALLSTLCKLPAGSDVCPMLQTMVSAANRGWRAVGYNDALKITHPFSGVCAVVSRFVSRVGGTQTCSLNRRPRTLTLAQRVSLVSQPACITATFPPTAISTAYTPRWVSHLTPPDAASPGGGKQHHSKFALVHTIHIAVDCPLRL